MIDLTSTPGLPLPRTSLYGLSTTTQEKAPMSITVLWDKLAENHRFNKQQRDLYRAISHAPTQASRQELLGLTTAYNNH
jgi:hypothetical protein